jgi:uncharacterized membrane protein
MRTFTTKQSFSRVAMVIFYSVAGFNHFINPNFYLPLIPPYFSYHSTINIISGAAEILFGLLLVPIITRKWAAYSIALMLIAFIPVHIFFIQQNSCAGELCVPPWAGWVRLVMIHPLLIYWAWSNRK